jgi:hypothetical protein
LAKLRIAARFSPRMSLAPPAAASSLVKVPSSLLTSPATCRRVRDRRPRPRGWWCPASCRVDRSTGGAHDQCAQVLALFGDRSGQRIDVVERVRDVLDVLLAEHLVQPRDQPVGGVGEVLQGRRLRLDHGHSRWSTAVSNGAFGLPPVSWMKGCR